MSVPQALHSFKFDPKKPTEGMTSLKALMKEAFDFD
jgi:hypothetical protein